ncbi:MAG: EamA family transporter [Terriglobia bacterium]
MDVLFLLLAVLCFSAFYILIGHSQRSQADPMGLNLVAFAAGAVISLVAAGGIRAGQFPGPLLAIGGGIGLAAGFGLLGITMATRSGLSVSIVNTCVSLSLAVPIVLSLAIYGESPGARKAIGLGFAAASILLIQSERR